MKILYRYKGRYLKKIVCCTHGVNINVIINKIKEYADKNKTILIVMISIQHVTELINV